MANPGFVEDYVTHLQKHYQGEITQLDIDSRQNIEWQRIIPEILSSQPDAVILLTEATMTGIAAQKLKEAHFTGSRIATLWAQTPELLQIGAMAAEGLSIITFIDPDNQRDAYLQFNENMLEKFNKPANARSARTHELISILADALRRCPNCKSQELKAAIIKGKYESILGEVTFDQYGDVLRPVYEVVVRNGQFKNNGEIP